MTATAPATPGTARAGTFTRVTVTIVMAVIASLAFVFSFGNVWALALRLGVPHPIAPLIAPMVDLSVVGLLVALHHLVLTGTEPDQLRSAARLMHLCGALTLALNTAEPVIAGHYGRACLDTVAPALLLGWGTVGPDLLRHLAPQQPAPARNLHLTPSTPWPRLLPRRPHRPTSPPRRPLRIRPRRPRPLDPRRSPNPPRTPSPSPLPRPPRPLSPRPPRPRSCPMPRPPHLRPCPTSRPRSLVPPAASPTTTAPAPAT